MKVAFNDVSWYGRFLDNEEIRYFDYSSSGFSFILKGKKAEAVILSDPEAWDEKNKGVIGVYISEGEDCSWKTLPSEPAKKITLLEKENKCVLFESSEEKTVCIRVIKLSECAFGYAGLKSLEVEGNVKPAKPETSLKLEVIGDSITCGYGIEGVWEKDTFTTQQERADKSYAFLTAKAMNAELQCCSWSGIGLISNYVDPVTVNLPDTHWLMPANWPYTDKSLSLRLGLEPEIWDEKKFSPDIVVIHLGTNDQSWVRKIEDRRLSYVSALRQLIEAVHRRSPKAKICCCLGVMGQELCDSVNEAAELFTKDFPNVKIKTVKFPVQLESDGIAADWHPSAKTHEKIADILIEALKEWC
ncbi:MAG: GDSL-type esterase/lipase family protein [Treponema sp.]|nr:GDSL-type esterase/lipase family protein [Treponema sp.]